MLIRRHAAVFNHIYHWADRIELIKRAEFTRVKMNAGIAGVPHQIQFNFLNEQFEHESKKGDRRAMFKKRRTTTFVNDDDSMRLKELQHKFEVLRLKKLEKQHSASDLLQEKEDKVIKELVDKFCF